MHSKNNLHISLKKIPVRTFAKCHNALKFQTSSAYNLLFTKCKVGLKCIEPRTF